MEVAHTARSHGGLVTLYSHAVYCVEALTVVPLHPPLEEPHGQPREVGHDIEPSVILSP